MARKISVEILGDSTSLEKAFARSAKSAQQFQRQVTGSSGITNTINAQAKAVRGLTKEEDKLVKIRSKRASSIGPFRLAGVGLGAGLGLFAVTQAVKELGARLEVTGDEAFKTQGRLRNMGAALLSGNLVGAVAALSKLPQTIEQMGWTVDEVREKQAALNKVADGTAVAFEHLTPGVRAHTAEMEKARQVTEAAGGASQRQAEILTKGLVAFDLATAAAEALADAQERLGKYYVTRQGAVIKGTEPRDMTRVQDVASDGRRTRRRAAPPVSIRPLSPSERRELELIGKEATARVPLLQDRLRQLHKMLNNLRGTANVREEQRLKILTNIRNTEAEIAGITKDAAARRKAAAEAAAAAAEAARQKRIETKTGWLEFGIERAEDTKTVKDDVSAWRQLEKFLQERIRQEGRTLDLVRELWRARKAIRDLNKKESDADPLAGLKQASTKELLNLLSAGTGLQGVGRRTLAGNIAGLQLPPIYLTMDSQVVGRAVTKDQTRTGRRTSQQTSGRRG